MLYLLLLSYTAVFTGELLGDKLLYTLSALAARYRLPPIFCGVALAFMGKMLAAVILGGFVAHLPGKIVALLSAATFFTMALALSVKDVHGIRDSAPSVPAVRVSLVSFSVVFFSEWGDIGQITAATLAARYQMPLVIWLGGTLAMMTKGILAMTVGVALGSRVSQEILRYCGVCLLFGLGLLSLISVVLQR